jgi:Flp pilus assembly protein TadG
VSNEAKKVINTEMDTAQSRRNSASGQGLLEFAITATVLVLLLFGAFDVGRIFHTKIVISNASREAARYLTLHPDDNLTSFSDTIAAAISAANNSAVTLVSGDVFASCTDAESPDDGCDRGQDVTVTITKTYSFFLSNMLGNNLAMSSSTQMYLP